MEDKHEMPNLEHLVDIMVKNLDNQNEATTWYTSSDMRYARRNSITLRFSVERKEINRNIQMFYGVLLVNYNAIRIQKSNE